MIRKIKLCAAKQQPSDTEEMLLEETPHFQVLQLVVDIRLENSLTWFREK
jgi:hypothetical protein